MDIPRDKQFPSDAVQCDECGGHGRSSSRTDSAVDRLAGLVCRVCGDRGWLPRDHPRGRWCANIDCATPLPPDHVAIFCTTNCALAV